LLADGRVGFCQLELFDVIAGDELLGLGQEGLAFGLMIGAVCFRQKGLDPVDDSVSVDRPSLPDRWSPTDWPGSPETSTLSSNFVPPTTQQTELWRFDDPRDGS